MSVLTVPLQIDFAPEPRYRLHLLALNGGDAELQPGYRRAEEKLRRKVPSGPPAWTSVDEAFANPNIPVDDRAWFDRRDAVETLQLQKVVDALMVSPFAALPEGIPPVRVVAAVPIRPQPALAPRARAVAMGPASPPSLVWLSALALEPRAAIRDAHPDLDEVTARFLALMLAGQLHVSALASADLDTLLTDIVGTVLPPQHRGDETIAMLERLRVIGRLPEHPGEYERMLHGIPRRRADRIHRAWLRKSFSPPSL
jgi:hypothetical protein